MFTGRLVLYRSVGSLVIRVTYASAYVKGFQQISVAGMGRAEERRSPHSAAGGQVKRGASGLRVGAQLPAPRLAYPGDPRDQEVNQHADRHGVAGLK